MVKKVMKFITVDNVEKEEAFLEEMANQGWFFTKYAFPHYHFEKGAPGAYSYCIDYKETTGDEEEYLVLFKDAGWENVFSYPIFKGKWMYFRKRVQEGGGREVIFTDNDSMVGLLKRVRSNWTRFGAIFSVLLVVLGTLYMSVFSYPFLGIIILFVALVIIALYGKMYINITKKIRMNREV
ncbi:DUF2812 domain-containing protein [Listeria grandensis]|uniref:DUF2812 domain-containing protein n=1 Tax=Listeria grandensis TaxID=1494963 RepID=UPI00164CECC0|nr:DUF2812 domain-containing protein [Listeria grandensis]MBC6315757.1 DUF2812 domain-containing protein [Listeria grandensis]